LGAYTRAYFNRKRRSFRGLGFEFEFAFGGVDFEAGVAGDFAFEEGAGELGFEFALG
jgi:hypothetical protein